MNLNSMIKTFANDEAGAVTVDWVVLTAAIVGLGLAVIASVRTGTSDLATDIQTSLSGATVATLGTLGVNQ
jgi:Flp pilus assembly pilin Flp